MLLDIPEQEKLEIGRILEFKRKHIGLSVDTLTDKVCSKNTYYKLLKSSIAESEIYDMLLNKVGLYYAYENKSHLAYDCLWDFFLQEDWKNYYKQIDELLEKIDKTDVQSYPLFLALWIIKTPLDMEGICILELFPLLSNKFQELLSNAVMSYFYEEKKEDTYEFLENLKKDTFTNQKQYLFCLIKAKKYYSASVLCEHLLQQSNKKQRFSILLAKLFLVEEIQPSLFEGCLKELQQNLSYKEDWEYDQFMYTAGVFYYKHKNYEKAWPFLNKALQAETFKPMSLLFMLHIETLTNLKLDKKEEYFKSIENSNTSEALQTMLTYYKKKYENLSCKKLSDYLWNTCRKQISMFYPQKMMHDIIKDELYWISMQDGDKKRYYSFNKK